jgi:chaperone required for assembly of F1-ATPase
MREFLEDALNHRDDGYGRAQKAMQPELPRRFYKAAGIGEGSDGFTVLLDGRAARTPGRKPIAVPTQAIAELIVAEYDAQGEHIDPRTMPVTRLINSAIESGVERVAEFLAEVVRFAGNDLLLYRADTPRELVAEQERVWDGALVALARHFGIAFRPTVGIIHEPQPEATLRALADAISGEGLIGATALVSITSLTGSGLLTIGLRKGLFLPDAVWDAAHLDEDYQARLWGMDEEAAIRRARRRAEFDAAVAVLDGLGAQSG